MNVSYCFLEFGNIIDGGAMDARQTDDHQQVNTSPTASGIIAGGALAQPAISRTLALIATISLVAFALYLTRPGAQPASKGSSNLVNSGGAVHSDAVVEPSGNTSEPEVTPMEDHPEQKNTTHHSVIVNGHSIPVPANGNLHKTITDGNSTTTIDLSSGGSSSSTTTNTNISVHSHSSSSSSSKHSSSDGT
jgi:hypothetical protein